MTVRTRTTIMNQDENMKDGKYEEALERAKELHEAGNALTKAQMEIVFPELKESEDERIRKEMIAFICEFAPEHLKADFVAYLEKQKEQKSNPSNSVGLEQKPAEWSEEDERIICNLIRYFKCEEALRYSEEKTIAWLKSLRPKPYWKPSEEQIEALKYTLGNGGFYDKKALDSLLSDLQKLL